MKTNAFSIYPKNQRAWPRGFTQPIATSQIEAVHEQALFTRHMPPRAVADVVPGARPGTAEAQVAVFSYRAGAGAVKGGAGQIAGES